MWKAKIMRNQEVGSWRNLTARDLGPPFISLDDYEKFYGRR